MKRLHALQRIEKREGVPLRVDDAHGLRSSDFPLVLRAIGPLDRIVQAAGRCNREGRLREGRVVIFDPAEGGTPPGVYRSGTDVATALLAAGGDLHAPATYEEYFSRLFQAADLDRERIQELRAMLHFPEVGRRFRLIDEEGAPAVVRPRRHRETVDALLRRLRAQTETPRGLLRQLQPYLVSIRTRKVSDYERRGLLREVVPGLWEWLGAYDGVRGLQEGPSDPEGLVI